MRRFESPLAATSSLFLWRDDNFVLRRSFNHLHVLVGPQSPSWKTCPVCKCRNRIGIIELALTIQCYRLDSLSLFGKPQLVLNLFSKDLKNLAGKCFWSDTAWRMGGLHQPEKRNITFLRRNESKGKTFGYFSLLVSSFLNFKVLGLRKKKNGKRNVNFFGDFSRSW